MTTFHLQSDAETTPMPKPWTPRIHRLHSWNAKWVDQFVSSMTQPETQPMTRTQQTPWKCSPSSSPGIIINAIFRHIFWLRLFFFKLMLSWTWGILIMLVLRQKLRRERQGEVPTAGHWAQQTRPASDNLFYLCSITLCLMNPIPKPEMKVHQYRRGIPERERERAREKKNLPHQPARVPSIWYFTSPACLSRHH